MEAAPHQPLISIGLAVYNGERYLAEAIDSILAQTYRNFELIISDNASTDSTAAICQRYAADPRVRYYRNTTNIGGANNENLTFTYATGAYFRWAGHDDVLAPTMLERAVEALEADPGAVLCFFDFATINAAGEQGERRSHPLGRAAQPWQRFRELASMGHRCEATYGLMRASTLRVTGLQHNYTDSDRTFLAQLALHGRFAYLPELLFYQRHHEAMSTAAYPEWRQRMLWFDEGNRTRVTLPYWLQLLHYLQVIARAPVGAEDKLRCYAFMARWVVEERRWRKLGKDLLLAGQALAMRALRGAASRLRRRSGKAHQL
jgi:glycosyltransferase involved in cell wall biosynthesis